MNSLHILFSGFAKRNVSLNKQYRSFNIYRQLSSKQFLNDVYNRTKLKCQCKYKLKD